MADLSHDNDDSFHEIQLSGKQLVFLFMATTVVSVAIFLCGVLVGRGVRAEGIGGGEPIASAATPALEPVAEPAPLPLAVPEPPTPASEGELSYHDRLQRDRPTAENLTPRLEPKPEPERATPDPVEPAAPRAETSRTAERTRPERRPEPAAPVAAPAPRSRGWAVQVISLRDRKAANDLVLRLTGRGYPAFLVPPEAGAPAQLFKVQVGRYDDRREADQVSRRLRKEEQFDPFLVPPVR